MLTSEKMICNMGKEEMAGELEFLRFLRDLLLTDDQYIEVYEMYFYGDPDHNDIRTFLGIHPGI